MSKRLSWMCCSKIQATNSSCEILGQASHQNFDVACFNRFVNQTMRPRIRLQESGWGWRCANEWQGRLVAGCNILKLSQVRSLCFRFRRETAVDQMNAEDGPPANRCLHGLRSGANTCANSGGTRTKCFVLDYLRRATDSRMISFVDNSGKSYLSLIHI